MTDSRRFLSNPLEHSDRNSSSASSDDISGASARLAALAWQPDAREARAVTLPESTMARGLSSPTRDSTKAGREPSDPSGFLKDLIREFPGLTKGESQNPWDRLSSKEAARYADTVDRKGREILDETRKQLQEGKFKADPAADKGSDIKIGPDGKILITNWGTPDSKPVMKDQLGRITGVVDPRNGTLTAFRYNGDERQPSIVATERTKQKTDEAVRTTTFVRDTRQTDRHWAYPEWTGVTRADNKPGLEHRAGRMPFTELNEPARLHLKGKNAPDFHDPASYAKDPDSRKHLSKVDSFMAKHSLLTPEQLVKTLPEDDAKYLRAYLGAKKEHRADEKVSAKDRPFSHIDSATKTTAQADRLLDCLNKRLGVHPAKEKPLEVFTPAKQLDQIKKEVFAHAKPGETPLDRKDPTENLKTNERANLYQKVMDYSRALLFREDARPHRMNEDGTMVAKDKEGRVTSVFQPKTNVFTAFAYNGAEREPSMITHKELGTGKITTDLRLNEDSWLTVLKSPQNTREETILSRTTPSLTFQSRLRQKAS